MHRSLVADKPGVGLGCCLQGDSGHVLWASTCFFDVSSCVLMAEFRAIAVGFARAIEFSSSKVVVESDYKEQLISFSEHCLNEYGSILQHIFELSRGVKVCFDLISRNSNSVAHELAQHAFSSCYLKRWYSLFSD